MKNKNILLGQKGELAAVQRLTKLGYTILERNFRTKLGEIDIVAREKGSIVFIEVKTRSSTHYGFPAEAVTAAKRRQIAKAAMMYLSQNNLFNQPARFDVVSVLYGQSNPVIEVIRDAFELDQ